MKTIRIKQVLFGLALAGMVSSCDSFLDTRPEDLRSPDQIFETYSSTESAMFGVYSYIRNDMPIWDAPGYSTSDIDVAYTNVHTFDKGIWDATAAQYDKWMMYYQAIREATFFLKNLDNCKDKALTKMTREQWRAEVRCVRAYYYAQLMRMYGPVILLKDELVDFSQLDLSRPRNTWDECVEWLSDEFKALSENDYLPIVQIGENYARMSQSIAMAYRARLLLQSASDLFNGNPMYARIENPDGRRLFPLKKDFSKWEKARDAMQDVIELGYYELVTVKTNGKIDPYASYKDVFTTSKHKESIFAYLEDNGRTDNALAPNSLGSWGGGFNPTQEMVDSYAMNNGRYPITGYNNKNRDKPTIDVQANYSEVGFTQFTHPIEKKERRTFNMYINREPRFYVSVLYGGLSWYVSKKESQNSCYVEMFKNGNNGPDANHNHYSTGYAMIKMVTPDFECNPRKNVKRELHFMRYPEILLGYAEAAIEIADGEISNPNSNLFTYWNMVRERAGVPAILKAYPEALGDQNKLKELIRRERRVEFAYEGINFFDSRRWKIAEETEGNDIHGMNIMATGSKGTGTYPDAFFTRRVVEKRTFTSSFYLFPLPQNTINKNHDLVQNLNW